jgi:aryl-alcohol dehydrogenase-like predicted oxidoreductase
LARGRLTRDWDESTHRSETDKFGTTLYEHTISADRKVVEAVASVAAKKGVPRAQVALAWVLAKPEVSAPIIGASKPQHLDDALAALEIDLSEQDIAALEAPYVPHAIVGF